MRQTDHGGAPKHFITNYTNKATKTSYPQIAQIITDSVGPRPGAGTAQKQEIEPILCGEN